VIQASSELGIRAVFNRNLVGLGLVGAVFAALNVWFTALFYNIMCYSFHGYGGCPPVGTMIATMGASGVVNLLLPSFFLFPSLIFVVIIWLWLAGELRRAGQTRPRLWTFSFPLLALALGAIITLFASLISQGELKVYPTHVWVGSWALVLWPLLVTIVAWRTPPSTTAPETPPALTATPQAEAAQ
jgi:hypothetical protein